MASTYSLYVILVFAPCTTIFARHTGFRRIAQFHARVFRDIPSAIEIGGEFIREIAMQHVSVLQDLWIAYQEQKGN